MLRRPIWWHLAERANLCAPDLRFSLRKCGCKKKKPKPTQAAEMSLKCIHVFSYEFGHYSPRLGVTLGFSLSAGAVKRASTFAHRCNADREEGEKGVAGCGAATLPRSR